MNFRLNAISNSLRFVLLFNGVVVIPVAREYFAAMHAARTQ